MEETGRLFTEIISIMQKLRNPGGCPWDREQTHDTIKKHLIEEAYEAVEAIDEGDLEEFKKELGDLLLQVVFHSRIAEENGNFSIDDVLKELAAKLTRRHPHVFGETEVESSAEVLVNWEKIKKDESGQKMLSRVPASLPALLYAYTLQSKAARVGFDWEKGEDVLEKIEEEMGELKEAVATGTGIKEEIGDLIFSLVNLSRHYGADPEEAVRLVSKKFKKRFEYIEEKTHREGIDMKNLSLEGLDALWDEAKEKEG